MDQQTLKEVKRIRVLAVFNDNFRGAIKGGSDDTSTGFVNGAYGKENAIVREF